MLTKYVLPALSALGVVFAVITVVRGNRQLPAAAPVAEAAVSPFELSVAGAGLVEASTENIDVGTPVSGVVVEVMVKAGQVVQKGQMLFRLDDRAARSELAVRQAALESAQHQLDRLLAMPRVEDLPALEAKVSRSQAQLEEARTQLDLYQSVADSRAITQEEMNRRKFAVDSAQAALDADKANLALSKAGAWKPDVDVARAAVKSAEAQLAQAQTNLEILTVRAPEEGRVLQVNIRPGEFAQAGQVSTSAVMLGAVQTLHVRVDVDENDAWRVVPGSPAVAYVRGNRNLSAKLAFVRVEPYVLPKKSLTGQSSERVDTRVLQVVYAFDAQSLPQVYVGQQMDVYIDATPAATMPGAGIGATR